jgi:hypothetical protein
VAASTLGPCGPRLSPPHLIEVATTPPNELMSRLPPITRATVRDFLTYLREEIALNELSVQGVDRLSGAVALHKWTLEADEILNTKRSPEKIAEDEKDAHRVAKVAQAAVDSDFATLNAHMLVACWGALESFSEDVVVAMLRDKPDLLTQAVEKGPPVSTIKIPLAEYVQMSQDDMLRRIVRDAAQASKASLQSGRSRLEAVLEMFDLAGPTEASTSTKLFEMHQIRNVIIHRRSIADDRFVRHCAHLGYKRCDKVALTPKTVFEYVQAIVNYVTSLIQHLSESLENADQSNYEGPKEAPTTKATTARTRRKRGTGHASTRPKE